MNNSSNGSTEHPFVAFLNRWTAVFWFSVFIAAPIVFCLALYGAYYKRRRAKEKQEQRYWSDEIKADWLLLYITLFVYVSVTQDILLAPFSFEQRAVFMDGFKAIYGLPGYFWFRIFGGDLSPDSTSIMALILACAAVAYYSFKLYIWKPNGDRDSCCEWHPSKKLMDAKWKQHHKDDAQFHALVQEKLAHDRNHPENDDGWKRMSKARQRLLVAEWDRKNADIRARMDVCPRSKVFDN